MTVPLAGQWIGKISGTNSGTATLNVDSDRDQRGLLLVTDDDPGMVAVVVDIGWKPAGALTDIKFFSHDIMAGEKREGVSIPNRVEAIASIHGRHLEGEWSTDIPTGGKLSLELQDEKNPSAADYTFNHWADFEQWVKDRQREESHLIYRGHASNQFRLETSFHRTGRRDLGRYLRENVITLYSSLAPILPQRFDLDNQSDFTSFLYLARHHGYPTPLLDWTDSHYIASYFAFFQGERPPSTDGYVRVLEFDPASWSLSQRKTTLQSIFEAAPVIDIVHAIPLGNARAIPQQSRVMFSNVANIERLVDDAERTSRFTFMNKVDLNLSMRDEVMAFLRYVGITPATMFPGLDGTCRAIAQKAFNS